MAGHRDELALVYVIVLHGGKAPVLPRCMSSLEGQSYGNFRVIVVDNVSGDESVERARGSRVHPEVIRTSRRLGFAAANNVGVRWAMAEGAKYVVLLNDDAFPEEKWLEELVSAAEGGERVGVVGPKVLFDADRQFINSTGLTFNLAGLAWDRGIGRVDCARWDKPCALVGVTGASMLLSCRMLREVGLLDEGYPVYYEDLDLCIRARMAGYRVVYAPRAVVSHLYSATYGAWSKGKEFRSTFSRARFIAKLFPRAALVRALLHMLYEKLRDQASNLLRGRAGMLGATAAALARAGVEVSNLSAVRGRGRPLTEKELGELAVSSYGRPELHVPSGSGGPAPDLLEIGTIVLGEGWYARDDAPPSGRWMAKRAGAAVTPVSPGDYSVSIRAWLPEVQERRLKLYAAAEGRSLGEAVVQEGMGVYDFSFVRMSGETRIEMELSDFIPSEKSGDYRDLGIKVCGVELNLSDATREEAK